MPTDRGRAGPVNSSMTALVGIFSFSSFVLLILVTLLIVKWVAFFSSSMISFSERFAFTSRITPFIPSERGTDNLAVHRSAWKSAALLVKLCASSFLSNRSRSWL